MGQSLLLEAELPGERQSLSWGHSGPFEKIVLLHRREDVGGSSASPEIRHEQERDSAPLQLLPGGCEGVARVAEQPPWGGQAPAGGDRKRCERQLRLTRQREDAAEAA